MKVTYYGQSCFLVKTNGKSILFDPFISPNPLAKHIDISDICPDFVLLTHGHADHVADAETIAKNNNAMVVSNFEIASHYGEKGLEHHPMNHGGKWNFDFGTAKYVTAIHTSTLPDGSNGGAPGGFVVWNQEGCFYHAGDTALTMDMKLIPATCPALDFAILPIGDNFTMGYDDAAIASEFIECDKIIACHYDTFGYIKVDKGAAEKAFASKGKQLIFMEIGEELDF